MSNPVTHFEVYEDTDGEFRWRLVSSNGQIVAVAGEGFTTEDHAWRSLNAMRIWVEVAFANLDPHAS